MKNDLKSKTHKLHAEREMCRQATEKFQDKNNAHCSSKHCPKTRRHTRRTQLLSKRISSRRFFRSGEASRTRKSENGFSVNLTIAFHIFFHLVQACSSCRSQSVSLPGLIFDNDLQLLSRTPRDVRNATQAKSQNIGMALHVLRYTMHRHVCRTLLCLYSVSTN